MKYWRNWWHTCLRFKQRVFYPTLFLPFDGSPCVDCHAIPTTYCKIDCTKHQQISLVTITIWKIFDNGTSLSHPRIQGLKSCLVLEIQDGTPTRRPFLGMGLSNPSQLISYTTFTLPSHLFTKLLELLSYTPNDHLLTVYWSDLMMSPDLCLTYIIKKWLGLLFSYMTSAHQVRWKRLEWRKQKNFPIKTFENLGKNNPKELKFYSFGFNFTLRVSRKEWKT